MKKTTDKTKAKAKAKKTTKAKTKKTKTKKVEKQISHVAIILDESGSMSSVAGVTINGVNEQIQKIKEAGKSKIVETFVSFVTFNSNGQTKFRVFNQPVDSLKEITAADYKPNGLTAMYDAVGETFDKYLAETKHEDKNTTYLVVIVSDGEENDSKKYLAKDVAEKIQALQVTGRWTISYMGANQDLSKVSKDLGISLGNMAKYSSTRGGTMKAMSSNAMAVGDYMTTRSLGAIPRADALYSAKGELSDFTEDKDNGGVSPANLVRGIQFPGTSAIKKSFDIDQMASGTPDNSKSK
jgi:Mg-chelatase subunit ChlD